MRVGVDVVSTARIAADVERWGDVFLREVLTSDEQCWCRAGARPAERVAACLAVKEAAVKALGGRPPGFRWDDVELLPWDEPFPGTPLDLAADELSRALAASVERRPCRLRRGASFAATSAIEPLGAAWGSGPAHVVALVTLG